MVQRINLKDIDILLEPDETTTDTELVKGRLTGAEGASVTLSTDDTVAYEGGSYFPAEIIDGKINIEGSLDRAWINNAFLKALFPVQGDGRYKSVLKPSFTLRARVSNSKTPKRNVTIYGVKFNSANIQNLTVDSYATQNLPFNATGYKFAD